LAIALREIDGLDDQCHACSPRPVSLLPLDRDQEPKHCKRFGTLNRLPVDLQLGRTDRVGKSDQHGGMARQLVRTPQPMPTAADDALYAAVGVLKRRI